MNAPITNTEVAIFQPTRLPYHDKIKERFGVDHASWKALVEAIYPSAKSADSVVMALSYCRARNLDPFKKPVHIVPMWDSKRGEYVETVWPGIAELRTTAFRTKQYVGCDEAEFGPPTKLAFNGRVKGKEGWQEKSVTVEFPQWCRMTVYRDHAGRVCKFVGPKVKWIEAYATIGNSELPNEMWQSRPEGQLEKCAEAAALRKAFPEELGNELTAEEMAGRSLAETRDAVPRRDDGPPPPRITHQPPAADLAPGETMNAETGEVTWGEPPPPTAPDQPQPTQQQQADLIGDIPAGIDRRQNGKPAAPQGAITADEQAWLNEFERALGGCNDVAGLSELQVEMMMVRKGQVGAQAWADAEKKIRKHVARVNSNILAGG